MNWKCFCNLKEFFILFVSVHVNSTLQVIHSVNSNSNLYFVFMAHSNFFTAVNEWIMSQKLMYLSLWISNARQSWGNSAYGCAYICRYTYRMWHMYDLTLLIALLAIINSTQLLTHCIHVCHLITMRLRIRLTSPESSDFFLYITQTILWSKRYKAARWTLLTLNIVSISGCRG